MYIKKTYDLEEYRDPSKRADKNLLYFFAMQSNIEDIEKAKVIYENPVILKWIDTIHNDPKIIFLKNPLHFGEIQWGIYYTCSLKCNGFFK